jgi:cyclohexa-1,5-dienecarbonyl-CoA hydratase
MRDYQTITAEPLEGGAILRLVLNQPRGNVLTGAMLRELGDALGQHREDRHLKLVVIRGAGGNFSFGASIEEHQRDQVHGMLRGFHAFVRDVASFPVPLAALVEGRCLGGAFELALCCHFVFATANARFGCPEIKLGVFPPVLAAIGAERLPGALAERLLLTGEEMDSSAAASAGLVAAVFDTSTPEASLLDWYRAHLGPLSAFAVRQATLAFRSTSGVTRALDERLPAIERQYLDAVVASHDGNEGIAAFLARRAPQWEDR